MKNFYEKIGFKQKSMYCFVLIIKTPLLSGRALHFIRSRNSFKKISKEYHWIHDVVISKKVELEKNHTDDNKADMIKKIIDERKF